MNHSRVNYWAHLGLALLTLSGSLGLTSTTSAAMGEQGQIHRHQAVCGTAEADSARCYAQVVVDSNKNPQAAAVPTGYGPVQFHAAYASATQAPTKQIIGIVDAYNDPNIASDLATYSAAFGIPGLPNCVGSVAASATPCFSKVNQNGGTNYPKNNSGWALEIALDVETAHAMCQNCSLVLVEASSSSYSNLMTAVDQAVKQGATVISNSYGSNEFSSETAYDSHLNHPGIAITFSSGDSGYGAQYPAASPYVTAVGGTTLNLSSGNYGSESVWNGAGSGCSSFEAKPSWQTDSLCSQRTISDVSADADPNTGAAVYDSVTYQGFRGWFQVGGTSLAAPLVAGTYALAGGVPSGVNGASLPYSNGTSSNLHDVAAGSNGSCGGTYLCTAVTGYDGPTGQGTPNGTTAF